MKVKTFALLLTLAAATSLQAYDFQSGDLYYNITNNSSNTVEVTYEFSSNSLYDRDTLSVCEAVYVGKHLEVDSCSVKSFYIQGYVQQITENAIDTYKNINFYMSDNLENSSNLLYAYRVMAGNEISNEQLKNLKVGDFVLVYAQILNYKGSLIETNNGGPRGTVVAINDFGAGQTTGIPSSSIGPDTLFIPDKVQNKGISYRVVGIGDYAFEMNSPILLVLPPSVTYIGRSALKCAFLYAFSHHALSIEAGNSIEKMYVLESAKDEYGNDTLQFLKQNLTAISGHCYLKKRASQSASLIYAVSGEDRKLVLPKTFVGYSGNSYPVTSIGNSWAFIDCSDVASVTIPESIEYIHPEAFSHLPRLTEVVWRARTYPDCTQGVTPFYQEGSFDLRRQIKSFTFGENVQNIPAYLCAGMSTVRSMQLPNSVKKIGFGAFAGCTGVSQLSLGTGLEHIADSAFAGCSRVSAVTLPTGLADIGNYAFEGTSLVEIASYATLPPLAESTTFPHYNATLSVPCDLLQDYRRDVIFGNFASIKCIGADEVETINEVTVEPSANDAVFTWPSEAQASTYTLEIRKDGEVFCTLIFNGFGQLMGIAFAPSSDGANPANRAAASTSSGYRFTVTGLDEASAYTYDLTVKDADDKVVRNYTGTFATDGATALHNVEMQEIHTENGRIVCDSDFQIFDLLGRNVTRLNGQLNGVYVVKCGDKAQKVVVSSK